MINFIFPLLSLIIFIEWIVLQRILGSTINDLISNPLNLILLSANILFIIFNKYITQRIIENLLTKKIVIIELIAIILLLVILLLNKLTKIA